MRYFVVAFQSLPVQQEIQLRDLFGENGFRFWHRFPNVWLVITETDIDVFELQDMIAAQIGWGPHHLAVEFDASAIAVSVPDSFQSWFEKHLNLEFVEENSAKPIEQKE